MKGRREHELEKEANHFAMCFLMPEKLVRREVKKLQPICLTDDEPLKKLAQIFDVSITAMAIRLSQIYSKK
jgi:Zn-dependent peptidase ImmA (M78 family)